MRFSSSPLWKFSVFNKVLPKMEKFDFSVTKPLVVVSGCTGTGKSDLAIAIAKKFGGDVISADSMQIYKGES